MRQIKLLFNALRSLGSLALILLLGVVLVVVSSVAFAAVLDEILTVYDDMMRTDYLKDVIEYQVMELALAAGYYADYEDVESLERAREFGVELGDSLQSYQTHEDFWFPEEQVEALEDFSAAQENQMALVTQLEAAIGAGDAETVDAIQEQIEAGTDTMNGYLASLVFDAEMDFATSSRQVWRTLQIAAIIGVASLVLLPLLAIWALGIASRMGSPLLALATAFTALGGGQFRTSLTGDTARRKDRFGDLARAVEELAAEVDAQERTRQTEIQQLRQELHASRRRKIVYSTAKQNHGG